MGVGHRDVCCCVCILLVVACGRVGFLESSSAERDANQISHDVGVLDVDAQAAAECGARGPEPGEACDDGNQQPNDGCAPDCTLEDQGPGANACADVVDLSIVAISANANGAFAAGDTTSNTAIYASSCTGSGRPDQLFSFALTVTADITVRVLPLTPTYDVALFLMGVGGFNCGNSSGYAACTNEMGSGQVEVLQMPGLAPGRYFIAIDAATGTDSSNDSGQFELHVTVESQ